MVTFTNLLGVPFLVNQSNLAHPHREPPKAAQMVFGGSKQTRGHTGSHETRPIEN
jgi:hypothetical protein